MSKILIIEDDSEIAMLERDYLEIEGFETTVIATARRRLRRLFGADTTCCSWT